jgi:hypothetical protein
VSMMLGLSGFHRGRQIRVNGRLLFPPIGASDAWASEGGLEGGSSGIPDGLRGGLAARWRENGKTEHASVAAFAKLSLDLIAVGAPPALLIAASRDAEDEIRHAERCFALARAIDGQASGPQAFPEALGAIDPGAGREARVVALAVDSLLDGALYEGVSARIVAKLARRARVPAIAALLKAIAADEGRHAAHAWDVVEWCVAEGGEPVVRALSRALALTPPAIVTDLPEPARDGSWEAYGIHGTALEASEHEATLSQLRSRVAALAGEATERAA